MRRPGRHRPLKRRDRSGRLKQVEGWQGVRRKRVTHRVQICIARVMFPAGTVHVDVRMMTKDDSFRTRSNPHAPIAPIETTVQPVVTKSMTAF